MEIRGGEIVRNELSQNAMGGSEILALELAKRLDPELLKEFHIVNSRVRELDNSKIRILWAHDLAADPEANHLLNGGWNKFHRIVFVSNYQMNSFIDKFGIPYSKCVVIQNAINPIEYSEKDNSVIKIGYWSTPHRGLSILVPVFKKLAEDNPNIQLDVFSSFKIYGWEQQDEQFKDLFDECKNHPQINYHGSVGNSVIREYTKTAHILGYPSIWKETSCIVLMEAMAAGMLCVHPNYAALPETAANWTYMYPMQEDLNAHAFSFYNALGTAIHSIEDDDQSRLKSQSAYANVFYNWDMRVHQWNALLQSLLKEPREIPGERFTYST
jgi:UDP-glucose:(glucosyl)LPS alpha-1,2-glucosyltransferase